MKHSSGCKCGDCNPELVRKYAGGGAVELAEDEEGRPISLATGKGTPFVNADKYPGWPQMRPLTSRGVTEA